MPTEWFYSKSGQQLGPIPSEQLKQLATSGQLQPSDLVWKDGMGQWVESRKIKGLFPHSRCLVRRGRPTLHSRRLRRRSGSSRMPGSSEARCLRSNSSSEPAKDDCCPVIWCGKTGWGSGRKQRISSGSFRPRRESPNFRRFCRPTPLPAPRLCLPLPRLPWPCHPARRRLLMLLFFNHHLMPSHPQPSSPNHSICTFFLDQHTPPLAQVFQEAASEEEVCAALASHCHDCLCQYDSVVWRASGLDGVRGRFGSHQ